MGRKRSYRRWTQDEKNTIIEAGIEYGPTLAAKHCSEKFGHAVSKQLVSTYVNKYQESCEKKDAPIPGRPTKASPICDRLLCEHIKALYKEESPITINIVIGAAIALFALYDRTLLKETTAGASWVKSVLKRCKIKIYVYIPSQKVRYTSKKRQEKETRSFFRDICIIVYRSPKAIQNTLILNIDQIQIEIIPAAGNLPRQILTILLGMSMSGDLLPLQVIYIGTNKYCLPTLIFPSDWHVTYNASGLSNTDTMLLYNTEILIPYIEQAKGNANIPQAQETLLILDRYTPHKSKAFKSSLEGANISYCYIPSGKTKIYQPVDAKNSAEEYFKNEIDKKFQDHYASLTSDALERKSRGEEHWIPELDLSVFTENTTKWIQEIFLSLKSKKSMLKQAWVETNIKTTIEDHSKYTKNN